MRVDKGLEFYNKVVPKLFELNSTENKEKSCVIERFNRTVKYLSANNTWKFVDALHLLVDQFNTTIHSSIKMTTKEASRKQNENKLWRNLYPEFGGKTLTSKFSIGDNVWMTNKKKLFDKSYTQIWTEEILQFRRFNWPSHDI